VAEQPWEYKIVEGSQESVDRIINESALGGWEVDKMACMPGARGEAHIVIVMRRRRPA
jgi:hypothetical protein